jgi:dienelactone hydrolase
MRLAGQFSAEIGVQASVFRYPLNVRHPAPLDALRAEIRRRRAAGARRIGLIGFSAGGHLAGLAALAPGAAADQTVQFAVLGYAITSMETETYRPARLILLGEDASPQLRRSTSLDALVTPESPPFFGWHTAEDPYVPPEHTYRFAAALAASHVLTPCMCSPTARTASAWPRALARPRSGPRWRKPGSGNRQHHRDHPASRAHHPGRSAVPADVSTAVGRASSRYTHCHRAADPGHAGTTAGGNT